MRSKQLTRILAWIFILYTLHVTLYTSTALCASKGNPPVAYWKFDESGGGTAYDESTNNNDGTLNAGAGGTNTTVGQMWTRQGKIGGALECDGTDDIVNAGNGASLNITGSITITAWIKPSASIAGEVGIVNKYGSGYEWTLRTLSGKAAFTVDYPNGTDFNAAGTTSLSSGNWYFLTGVYNATTQKVHIYVNGIQEAIINGPASIATGSNPVTIGGQNRVGYYFPGLIEDVKIYNYARTADQILVDYNAGTAVHLGAGTDSNEGNPPIAYYAFDENTGQTVYDRSGASNNGTLGSTSGSDANDPIWSAGKYGSALKFDGTNDMVEVLDTNNTLDLTTAGTIECWAYINNSYRFWIAAKCASASNPLSNYYFGTGSGNTWLGGIGNGTTQQDCADPNAAPTGIWTHAAFTFDGTKLKLYINGIKVNEVNQTITPLANNDHLSIGCWGTATSYPANGYIDEIRIYNYARTQAQIAYDYNKGKPVAHYKFEEGGGAISHNEYSSADTGTAPVGWWRFDAGTGTSCVDSSGNSLTATASAASWTAGKIGPYGLNNTSATVIDNSLLEGMSSLTISAWVYPTILEGTDRRIVEKGLWENADMSYRLMYQTDWGSGPGYPNGYWNFHIKTSTGNYNANGPNGVSANRKNMWHYIVGVLDGSAGKVRIYDNGILIGESNASGTINTNAYDMKIWTAAVGIVDDVRIYNYARTAEQIYNDYKTTHGTLVGDTKFVDGKMGKALQFDGSGDYVEAPDQTSLNPDSQITVAAWIKPSAGDYRTIVSKGYDTNDGGYALRITRDSEPIKLFFQVYNAGGTIGSAGVYSNITNGNWYHVVGTYDGSYVRLYINGILNGSGALTGSIKSNTLPVRFGRLSTSAGGTEYYPGLIDDVRIYNYARTADQILQDYNAGVTTRLGGQSAGEADPWGGAMPVGYWKLDENTGVKAYDASGNGNNGTLTNGTTWAQGKNGSALSFNGSNTYVNCGNNSSLNITGAITLEAWVKYDTMPGSRDVICHTGCNGYMLYAIGGTDIAIAQQCNGNTLGAGVNLNDGMWHHVAGTYDGTTANIYVDGVRKNSGAKAWTFSNTGNLAIGRSGDGNSEYFNGKIDDVKIYNYARTQAQIAWDYNRGKPVARCRFEEGSGATAYNDSGNGNNGTITIGGSGTQTTVAQAWTNGANGKFGKCMSFDGTDDYVEIPAINIGTGPVTFSVWAKGGSRAANQEIGLITAYQSGKPWFFTLERSSWGSGGVTMYVGYPDQTPNTIGGGLWAPSDTNWHYIAMTRDSSSIKLYFDGKEVANSTNTNFTNFDVGSKPIRIGYPSQYYWDSFIDDVRIYNYARTADQILQDYNAGLAAKLGE